MQDFIIEALKYIAVITPVILVVISFMDRKSEKRQKILQDSIFLMLTGIECIGELSMCNARELKCQVGIMGDNTERALKNYEAFSQELSQFKNKVTSRTV